LLSQKDFIEIKKDNDRVEQVKAYKKNWIIMDKDRATKVRELSPYRIYDIINLLYFKRLLLQEKNF
jgi:hypothetical protein